MNLKKFKMPKKMRLTTTSSSNNKGSIKLKVKGIKMVTSFKGIKKMNIAAAKKLRRTFKPKSKTDAEAAAVTGSATAAGAGRGSSRRKWIAVVRKKMWLRPKFPHPRIIHKGNSKANNSGANNAKNIIIIHNNTSIASNEDYNSRTSCVEIKDLATLRTSAPNNPQLQISTDDNNATANLKDEEEDEEEEMINAATSGSLKEVDVTSIDSAAPPPADQASKDDEEEEKDTDHHQEHQIQHHHKGPDTMAAVVVDTEANIDDIIRLTEEKAIIHIQSVFRAHLARRAYKALKSLVKLQAVVRGVCVRRQARMALHCMNSLARLQVRVRARQPLINGSSGANVIDN